MLLSGKILQKSSGFAKGVSGPAGPMDGGEESQSGAVDPDTARSSPTAEASSVGTTPFKPTLVWL